MNSSCYLPTCMYRKLSPMVYPNKLCSGDTKLLSKGDLRHSSSEPVNLDSRWIHLPRSHCRDHSIKYKIQMLLCVWNCSSGNLCSSKLIRYHEVESWCVGQGTSVLVCLILPSILIGLWMYLFTPTLLYVSFFEPLFWADNVVSYQAICAFLSDV